MKTKIVFVAVAVWCLVWGSCKQPTSHSAVPAGLAKGYGKVSVSLTADGSRTARSVFPPLEFDRLAYTFTKAGGAPAELSPDADGSFTLPIGEYTVAVSVYAADTLSASGVSAPFSVSQGDNPPVVVPLAPAVDGMGVFVYLISYPDEAWGNIALYSYPGMADMGLAPSHVCGYNGVTEWVELPAGSYLLTLQATLNGRTAGISEAVHVYPAMETYFEKELVDVDFIGEPLPPEPPEPPITGGVKVEYYWVDQHDSLITASGNEPHIAVGETIAITAQGTGYTVRDWYLNGVSTVQSGNTFYFSSVTAGKYTVGLFVEKNGKLYNSNIVITVEGTAEPQGGEPPTRTVTIDMYDLLGDGWNGGAALRINVNGTTIANNVRVSVSNGQNIPYGQRYANTYTFPVYIGDVVQFYWVAGTGYTDISFIVYYTDTPPIPAFCTDNKGANSWSGANALLYRLRGAAPAGLVGVADGTLLGSFFVE
jgi:hypothetical protein